MSELGKPFLKKSDKENKKLKSMTKCRWREQRTTSERCKFDSNEKLGLE